MIVPPSVHSPEDVLEVADELRTLAHAPKKQAAPLLSDAARDMMGAAGIGGGAAMELTALAHKLEGLYDTAPRVSVTLAAPVGPREKDIITGWFRENCAGDVLVSFGFTRSLLGGALVRAGSRVHDWSFRSKLLDSPVRFVEVFDRV